MELCAGPATRSTENLSMEWVRTTVSSMRVKVRRDFATADFLRRLSSPAELMAPPAEPLTVPSESRMTDVVRVSLPEFPNGSLIVKHYRQRFWRSLKDLFRPSRARSAVRMARRLRRLGLSSATPIAALDRRCCGWLTESFFIAVEVTGSQTLRTLWGERLAPRRLRPIIRALGRAMAALHAAGIRHTDSALGNFLVRDPGSARPEIVLIDLDALRPAFHLSWRAAIADLRLFFERIAMSPRHQLWFIAEYSRAWRHGPTARMLARRLGVPATECASSSHGIVKAISQLKK